MRLAITLQSYSHQFVTRKLLIVIPEEEFVKRTQNIRTILMAGALAFAPAAFSQEAIGNNGIKRVLLISIDGMHTLDYLNCSQGIAGVNNGAPYCPNLAALGSTGLNYL